MTSTLDKLAAPRRLLSMAPDMFPPLFPPLFPPTLATTISGAPGVRGQIGGVDAPRSEATRPPRQDIALPMRVTHQRSR